MGKIRKSTLIGLTLSLLFIAGCKVSCTTANISSLKLSKDEAGSNQTKEFAPGDTVYALATISNNPSKVSLKFRLFAEDVPGGKSNSPVADSDKSFEIDGDGRALYYASLPANWPAGRYRVEVVMMVNNEQKDQKTETFTVKGGAAAAPSPAASARPPSDATPEENTNEDGDESPPNDK